MTVLSSAEVIGLWIMEGGSISTAQMALARAYSESSLNDSATSSNPDGGTNVGVYQLDTRGVGSGYSVAQLSNPVTNTRITVDATKNGKDWSDWADNYSQFLSKAGSEVAAFQASAGGSVENYAKSITANLGAGAGVGGATTGTGNTTQQASLTSIVGSVQGAVSDLNDVATAFTWLSQPSHWFRIGALFVGVLLLVIALYVLVKATTPESPLGPSHLPIPIPVTV